MGLVLIPPTHGQSGKPITRKAESSKKEPAKKESFKHLVINDALNPGLPMDPIRPQCHHKVHEVQLEKGVTYTIDMGSTFFDAYLRLEDSKGVKLAEDDDSGGNNNARITFTPKTTESYRLIATSFLNHQTGPYMVMVRVGTGHPALPGLAGGVSGGGVVYVPAPEQVHDFGILTLAVRVPQNPPPMHGYTEYRILAKNKTTESHQLRIVIPQSSWNMATNYLKAITRQVEVGPSAEVSISLFQPDLPLNGNGIQVVIDGQPRPQFLPLGPQRGQHAGYTFGTFNYQPTILISSLTNSVQGQWLRGGFVHPSTAARVGVGFGMYQFTSFAQSGDSGSKHWLGYSGYDGVVIRSAELAARGPEVEAALRQYVECGGSLVVVGPWKAPEAWNRTRHQAQGITRFYPGFGQCLQIDELDPGKWSSDRLHTVTSSWTETAEPWLNLRTATDANLTFPVVEHLTLPVRGLFILMLVFSILIGPVNLYVLARMKRRLWMLWTVPLISLMTCLAVLGYMFVDEGWAAHVRTESFTVLDENAHQAATLGWIGYYTPVVPSDGLHFSPQTELTAQARAKTYRMTNHPHTLDWTDEQHLANGWLTARLPAHFLARKNERRLERVTVSRKDGVLTMVNGLKADIRAITFLTSGSGPKYKIYTAENVPAGQQAVLRPGAEVEPPAPERLRTLYMNDWLSGIRAARAEPATFLQPGCYLATLEATPFLEEGLHNAGHRQALAMVYGVMKEPIQD
jgi:hypothetical protein